MSLTLPRAISDALLAHARAEAPREACGVLAGRRARVERWIPVKNASKSPEIEFVMDPQELLAAILRIESDWGIETLGFYHSHPSGPPHPSRVDIERAGWPRAATVIAWLGASPGIGAWRIEDGRATAIEIGIE